MHPYTVWRVLTWCACCRGPSGRGRRCCPSPPPPPPPASPSSHACSWERYGWFVSSATVSSPALYATVDDGDADDDDDKDEAGNDENDDDLDAEHEGVVGEGSAVQLRDKKETRFFTAMEEPDALRLCQIFNPRHRLVCLNVAQHGLCPSVPTRIAAEEQWVWIKGRLLWKVVELRNHLVWTELEDEVILPILLLDLQLPLVGRLQKLSRPLDTDSWRGRRYGFTNNRIASQYQPRPNTCRQLIIGNCWLPNIFVLKL